MTGGSTSTFETEMFGNFPMRWDWAIRLNLALNEIQDT
jgi:hypothetical protein